MNIRFLLSALVLLCTVSLNFAAESPWEVVVKSIPAAEKQTALFNGKDLTGWQGDEKYWKVAEGAIVGSNMEAVPSSTYLFTSESYRDFRLLFEVKQTLGPKFSTMHSAVAGLGERFTDAGDNKFGFKGPLFMFCHDWGIWDAHRRNRVVPVGEGPKAELKGEWNLIEILVRGDRLRMAANGTQVFDFTDKPEMLKKSPLGLQLHANKQPQEYRFRGLVLTTEPEDRLVTVKK